MASMGANYIMGRRRQNIVEDIADLSSMLPCWLSLLLAMFAYFFFHQFADLTPGKITGANELFGYAHKQLYKTFAYFLQFIIPFALSLGALISLINTQRRYGFLATLKSLLVSLIASLAAVLLYLSWPPTLPLEITDSTIVKKFIKILPSQKKDESSGIEQATPTITKKEYVFSEQEILAVQEKLLKDRQDKIKDQPNKANVRQDTPLFEIELNNGRTIFSKNATITGETLSFESDNGLVVSMNMQDVKKVRKIIKK